MEGYKTITGIIITIAGMVGIAEKVGGAENLTKFFDVGFQLFGIVMTMYGSWKAHRKLKIVSNQVIHMGGIPKFRK